MNWNDASINPQRPPRNEKTKASIDNIWCPILLNCDFGCLDFGFLGNSHNILPLKFNMEPEKKSPEKDIPFGNHHFQVPC